MPRMTIQRGRFTVCSDPRRDHADLIHDLFRGRDPAPYGKLVIPRGA